MAKKRDKSEKVQPARTPAERGVYPVPVVKMEGISRRGWKVIAIGITVVVVGFYVLSLTDPAGQNWASTLSPFLLLGGYATIGIGIVLNDPEKLPDQNPDKKV